MANYRVIAALWLGLWMALLSPAAFAELVGVGQFELEVDPPWHRAAPDEETSLGSVILRLPDDLEVYLPNRQTRIRTAPDNFYAQIDMAWRSRYGEHVELDWLVAGGTRWRTCRRPSLEDASAIFQLVTAHGDRAYQVVIVAPASTTALPEIVMRLLAQGQWRDALPGAPESAPEVVTAPVPVASAATTPHRAWHLLRKVVARGRSGPWQQILREEQPRLGVHGRLFGLGVDTDGAKLEWFLEGERELGDDGGSRRRASYEVHWRADWRDPPSSLSEGDAFPVDLIFTSLALPEQEGADFGVRYELSAVCAPQSVLVAWLNALDQGRENFAERIGSLRKGCPGSDMESPASLVVMARPSSSSDQGAVTLPVTLQESRPDAVQRRVLALHFIASQQGRAPGDFLLSNMAIVYVYGPAE